MRTGRASGGRSARSTPSRKMLPPSGRSKPAIIRKQRRLAAAGRAEQREELAGFDRQADAVDRGEVAEPARHVLDFEERHRAAERAEETARIVAQKPSPHPSQRRDGRCEARPSDRSARLDARRLPLSVPCQKRTPRRRCSNRCASARPPCTNARGSLLDARRRRRRESTGGCSPRSAGSTRRSRHLEVIRPVVAHRFALAGHAHHRDAAL